MSWWTQAFWCESCEAETTDLFPKLEVPESIICDCGSVAHSCMSVRPRAQARSFGVKKPSNQGNRTLYHHQTGIHYSSFKDLERKAADKGMYPIGTHQESLDWIDQADTESAERQQMKREVKEYRDKNPNEAVISKEERERLKKRG